MLPDGDDNPQASRKVIDFPASPEEHVRRLKIEVERLAQQSRSEWLYYLNLPGYAEKYGVDQATLKAMIEAVVKEREKKQRDEQAERRWIEDRADKQRTVEERKQERKADKEQRLERQAKKDAEKKAEKKERERRAGLTAIIKLPKSEHEVQLRQLARRLSEDPEALRAELELLLAEEADTVRREAAEPWPEPVSTKELLDESLAQIRRYVVVHDDNAATIYALAVPFAWWHDEVAVYSPLFVVQGADIDMAKSLLCRIHSLLAPRPYVLGKPTGPAIYRLVDHCHPSMYIDNADRLLARDRDAADVVDLSWTRGTLIPRTDKGVVHNYDPFCFKMANGIDVLPHLDPSTRSRCITTEMLRKLPGDKVIDSKKAVSDERFAILRRKAMRWLKDNVEAIKNATPAMPEGFDNRLAENYAVLFAIADLAGGDWPKKIRAAAITLSREYDAPSMGRQLLAIFYQLFSRRGQVLLSEEVEQALPDYGDEWANYKNKGRPINKWEIASLLRPFKVRPDNVYPPGKKPGRGYKVEWFKTAFKHNLGKDLPGDRVVVCTGKTKNKTKKTK